MLARDLLPTVVMEQQHLTREDVIRTLGTIDDAMIADIIATGATSSDLVLAIDRLRNDTALWNAPPPRESRIDALCELLEPWWQADEEPEYPSTD